MNRELEAIAESGVLRKDKEKELRQALEIIEMAEKQAESMAKEDGQVANEPVRGVQDFNRAEAEASGEPLIGNRYYKIDNIGYGAMGVVSKAIDVDTGQMVVVKCVRYEDIGHERDWRRLQREIKAMGRVDSPFIVHPISAEYDERLVDKETKFQHSGREDTVTRGEAEEQAKEYVGEAILVMEHVDGKNLGNELHREGPMEDIKIANIIMQVCHALEAMHEQGIIHRDVKPENIFLQLSDISDEFIVRLDDLGLVAFDSEEAKKNFDKTSYGQQVADDRKLTDRMSREKMTVGTPNYMAPEQIMDKKLDGRADLYSLGIMMYELISGHRPFEQHHIPTLFQDHVTKPVPKFNELQPPIQSRRNWGKGKEGPFDKIVYKLLAKKPENRFQSAIEVAQAMKEALLEEKEQKVNELRKMHEELAISMAGGTWAISKEITEGQIEDIKKEIQRWEGLNSSLAFQITPDKKPKAEKQTKPKEKKVLAKVVDFIRARTGKKPKTPKSTRGRKAA